MSGVLLEAGTAYPLRTPGSLPVLGGVRVAHLFSFLCCIVFFVFCLPSSFSCVPSVANVSGLFILDCPFGFL